MTRTHDYQIISDTAPAIESRLATHAAVQVFIVLEKPIPSPYAK